MTRRRHVEKSRARNAEQIRTVRALRFRWGAVAVFVTALALRLVHVGQMHDTVFFSVLMGDSRGYDAWARDIAAGAWIGRDVFYQAPLYPYFLGVIYALAGRDLLIVRVVQAVLGALSCVALGYAGARLVSRRAGLVAGLMLAVYPAAIFFDGLIQKSVLDVLFVCVSLALISRIAASGSLWHGGAWLLLGVAMGALSLTRENAIVLVAVVALWALTVRTPRGSRTYAPAAMLVASLAIVLVPVALRNYAVGGGFYLTTSQFGSNLYIGNNPRADGSYMSLRPGRGSPEFERLDATELAEQAVGRRLTPAEVSKYWTDRSLAFIASDPAAWLRLLARKARLLWSATEIIDTESQESHAEYSLPLSVSAAWNFGVVLPFAVVGVWVLWRDRQRLWIVYALSAAYAASVVLFFVVARYRYPLVPFVMLFAAAGVVGARDWLRRATRTQITTAAATAAALTILSNWPLHTVASQQAITENNLGTALQEEGRVEEAVQRYRRALALDPGYVPALNNLGTALRAAGRVEEAVEVYDKALTQDPNRATVYLNRGNALMAQGRVEDAIASFRQAVAIDPRSTHAISALADALYDYGTAAIEAGALERATAALREAIDLKPDYAEAHNNLGIALASQGEIAEAVKHWQEALRLKPGFTDAQRNLERARAKK